jgi:hypothetical protein
VLFQADVFTPKKECLLAAVESWPGYYVLALKQDMLAPMLVNYKVLAWACIATVLQAVQSAVFVRVRYRHQSQPGFGYHLSLDIDVLL